MPAFSCYKYEQVVTIAAQPTPLCTTKNILKVYNLFIDKYLFICYNSIIEISYNLSLKGRVHMTKKQMKAIIANTLGLENENTILFFKWCEMDFVPYWQICWYFEIFMKGALLECEVEGDEQSPFILLSKC